MFLAIVEVCFRPLVDTKVFLSLQIFALCSKVRSFASAYWRCSCFNTDDLVRIKLPWLMWDVFWLSFYFVNKGCNILLEISKLDCTNFAYTSFRMFFHILLFFG